MPRVNEDGNETSGVPSVQLQAPLGTYLGWNTFRAGFFAGHGCGFQGGWIPFAKTKAERIANHDPRLSLEERYGTHDGYVAVVRKAAEQAVNDRFLLPDDAARILRDAEASTVLQPSQPAVSASPACEQLTSLNLTNAAVTLARAYPAGDFTSGRTFQVPAFCRVAVTAKPTSDSDIKVEVWLPERVERQTAGHRQWRILRRDQLRRARRCHRQRLCRRQHRHRPHRRSDGLRYRPSREDRRLGASGRSRDDGDRQGRRREGAAAGRRCGRTSPAAPPADSRRSAKRSAIPPTTTASSPALRGTTASISIYGFLWSWLATHDAGGKATLPAAKLPALARAVVAACDKQDGLEDGVIDDPRTCRFDPAALACTACRDGFAV